MLEITKHQVKLQSVNARAELHGDKSVPAFDLKFEAACPNDVLIHFHPELRSSIYKKADEPDLLDQIDTDALTALRFPKMGAIKWDWEGSGYALNVDYGLGGRSDIKLGDCKVDGVRIDPQNGGTVLLTFRVICHPETADVGRLCEMIQQNVEITLTPPAPTSLGELFGDDKKAA